MFGSFSKAFYRLYLFLILVLSFSSSYYGQTRIIDSLNLILRSSKIADTTKAKTLILLAWELKYINLNEAKKKSEDGIELSKKTNRYADVATGLKILGILNDETSHFKESINYYLNSITYYKIISDTISIARVECNIGKLYLKLNQDKEAAKYFIKCLPVFKKANFLMGINLANQYMGSAYFNLHNYDSALFHFSKSLQIVEANNMDDPPIYGNIGNCYFQKQDYKTAEKYISKCCNKHVEVGDSSTNLYFWKNMLASVYMRQGRTADAIKLIEESRTGYKKLGLYYSENNAIILQNLARAYAKNKKFEFAYTNILTVLKIKDTIFNKDFSLAMNEMKEKYEANKKEQELKLVKVEQEKERELAISDSKKQKLFLLFILAIAIGVGIIAIVVFRSLRITRKQKHLIEEQKLIVDESQRKIIGSINYAKKIQTSMLPSHEEMTTSLKEIFVFFKPKDIVSGDFYWFHHENNFSYLAVADCTGHGVPGAFMTMIAQSILNEVVIKQKITTPDEILNHLHSLIFKALKQHKGDEYSQDGMDISFVKIDHKNKMLTFAGARNHGFIVHNNQVETLKATAKSIGGLSLLGEVEPDRKFKAETFQLKDNALLILTSDGIFDQLNNEDIKFGINRFKETILKLDTNATNENVDFLEETFSRWKGSVAQLDDILLVGLRV